MSMKVWWTRDTKTAGGGVDAWTDDPTRGTEGHWTASSLPLFYHTWLVRGLWPRGLKYGQKLGPFTIERFGET